MKCPVFEAAAVRDDSMKAGMARRFKHRSERFHRQPLPRSDEDRDLGAKVRALLAAIRAHTNSDCNMHSGMDADTLYQNALRCLGENDASANESTKMVGEALKLINDLSVFLDRW